MKVEPFARLRADLQLAAEQAGDLAADRQAEAGAAIFAAGGAVGLLERLEDQLLLVLGDADAGVGDRDRDRLVGIAAAPDGWCSSRRSTQRTDSVTLPCAVNLKALDSRLSTICCSRFSSVRIVVRQVRVELDR